MVRLPMKAATSVWSLGSKQVETGGCRSFLFVSNLKIEGINAVSPCQKAERVAVADRQHRRANLPNRQETRYEVEPIEYRAPLPTEQWPDGWTFVVSGFSRTDRVSLWGKVSLWEASGAKQPRRRNFPVEIATGSIWKAASGGLPSL